MRDAAAHSERARHAMLAANFDCLARVEESGRAVDLAMSLTPVARSVIRCVDRATPEDHTALATMISEGDFIWGALVYEQGDPLCSRGLIETFHASELDRLVARLVELREAFREAG